MRAGAPATAACLAVTAAVMALVVTPAILAVAPVSPAAASASHTGPASHTPTADHTSTAGHGGTAGHAPTASQAGAVSPSGAARLVVGGARMADHGMIVNYPSAKSRRLPKVPAAAYVIADANTGQVLAADDPHGEFAPASTLKVLTAIALIPRLNPDAMVLASRQAASAEPNDVGLIPGQKYQVASLFKALLMISANDAAVALTQATGSFAKGMNLINAEAHHLQAYDVAARQPNGLPATGQVVSAYDEALIARQALATPAFMRYDSALAARFEVKRRHWVTLVNQNSLLTQYRGGIGGKIGWTVKSEATYIGMARRNGVTLIVTVLHCTPLAEITSGERLLDWGFAMAGRVKPVGTLVAPLAATAAAHRTPAARAHKLTAHARAIQLGSQAEARPTSHADADLAIGAGVVSIAVVGLGSLAMSRRKRAAPRR